MIYEDYLRTKPLYGAQTGIYAETCTDPGPEADEKMTEKLPIIYNVKEEYLAAVFETVEKDIWFYGKVFPDRILSETENDRRVLEINI